MGAAVNTYRCHHCGKTVQRDSDKRWMKSYCTEADRHARLWRDDSADYDDTTRPAGDDPREDEA